MNIDALSCSGHKFGGLKGSGFLYCKREFLTSMINGGGQEKGVRSGTENTLGIISMKYALEKILHKNQNKIRKIYIYLSEALEKIGGVINVKQDEMSHIISVFFKGISNEGLINYLDIHNIYVSSGAACKGNIIDHSHVLEALGYSNKRINQTIRISFSHETKLNDCLHLVKTIDQYIKLSYLNKKTN